MRDPVIQRIEASLQARGERPTGTTLRRVLTTCVSTPWAMLPEKLSEIQAFLELRLEGHMGDDEIRAAVEQRRRTRAPAPTGVAVIPIFGVISKRTGMLSEYSGGTSVEKLQADIRAALNDPSVAQIVFDVDSPGGSVEGVFELSEWIYSQRGVKPMKAVANDLMASAAYAIASAANEVVVTPSSLAGSIGVFAMHVDVSGMQRMAGIKTTLVKFGKYKAETDSSQPLSDEAREHLQERVDYYGEMFIAAVARNRGTTPDALNKST
jgi:signal peptide peptidase SppA